LAFTISCSCSHIPPIRELVADYGAIVKLDINSGDGHCSGSHIGAGRILSAAHCVGGDIETLSVILQDGRSFTPKVIIDNDREDVAILWIPVEDFPQYYLGEEPKPGDRLVSIGYPFWSREVPAFAISYMQFMAEGRIIASGGSYRGMSGGPVVDSNGFLVGTVSAVAPEIDIFGNGITHSHADLGIFVSVATIKSLIQ
jgi:S1-C subfamily serine protease